MAAGDGSHGISLSGAAGVTSTVAISGTVRGGAGAGRGVYLANGGTVTLAQGSHLRAASGVAIQSAAGSLQVDVQGKGRIGRNEQDIQRIQGGEGDGDTTTIRVLRSGMRDVILLENNVPSGEIASVMDGVLDRQLQLVPEAGAPESMDCGTRCWRWLQPSVFTSRALALEVVPQALLNLTRPARQGRQGDYESAQTGSWMRLAGRHSHYQADTASSHHDYDQREARIELGVQGIVPWWTRDGCKTLVGISGHFLDSTADAIRGTGISGQGRLDITGDGLGLHLSWYGADGLWARAEGRGTWYDMDLQAAGMRSEIEGFGWSLNLSGGRTLALAREGLHLNPELQLSWSAVRPERVARPFVASFERARSLRARMGLGVEQRGQWRRSSTLMYGKGSVEYEFRGETVVNTEPSTRLRVRPERLWGVLSLGAEFSGSVGEALRRLGAREYALSGELSGALGPAGNYEAELTARLQLHF